MILIHHPGTGTFLNLAECVLVDEEVATPEPLETSIRSEFVKAVHSRGPADRRSRIYLLAVREMHGTPNGGTDREVVVLDSRTGGEEPALPFTLTLDGQEVEFYDQIHDLFADVF